MKTRRLSHRSEDYLETIALLAEEHGHAHVRDIARARSVRMATVSEAIKGLAERGLVQHQSYGDVRLTSEGRRVAREVLRRHRLLFRFFHNLLALPPETADEEACRLEHTLAPETLARIGELVECVELCEKTKGAGCQCLGRLKRKGNQGSSGEDMPGGAAEAH